MSAEADFATQVIVRLADRLMKAEAELESVRRVQTDQQPKWARLGELLSNEPEYSEPLRKAGAVNVLDAAIAVLERRR